ncbi:MAG: restriction endonuclease subunit S [Hylemonella sp.]|nr:restriction endonuclease subunit S [Hylemonella sp.]
MRSERGLESRTGGRAATTGVIPGDIAVSVGNPNSPLPDGWKWELLTEVARLETGHTPSRRHPEYWGGSVPWIGIRDATGNHGGTIYKTAQYTNELGIRNSSARILPANTVCLSRTASVGYVVVMGVPMATSQDFVNWVCGPRLDHRYLKYVLLGERSSFLRFASGTTHQTIYFPEVKAFNIALPPIGVQQGIADILSALDDRANLLRQTNITLESIAQALFKSWFIDFDPVRANAEGREPEGMDAANAQLFPAEFEESALGLIPKGWRIEEIGRTAECVGGGTPSTKEEAYWEPPIHHWATPKDLSGLCSPVLLDTERRLSDAGLSKVSSGLLPSGTLLMSSRAPIGYIAIAQVPLAVNQGFIAIKPDGFLPPEFLYFWCHANMDAIKQKANGSTFMEISKTAFRPILLVLPPSEIVMRFADFVRPIFARITAGERQRARLADIRDALLPRLISGKVRLPEAQEQIDETLA